LGRYALLQIDGQPWFVSRDVTSILGYANPSDALKKRVDDEDKGVANCDTLGGSQKLAIINESGLYCLILSSKLPTAKAFKRWVTSEILPSIRKHGGYLTDNVMDQLIENPESSMKFFAILKEERARNDSLEKLREALDEYVAELKPKGHYYDVILQCPGAVLTSVIAKEYGMTAIKFNKLLHDLDIQFKFKTNGTWMLYKEYANKGYTITNTYYCKNRAAYIHMCWTQKGRQFLYDFLGWHGIYPNVEQMDFDGTGG
jgi:prophage antirepressor-like protein